MTTDQPAPHPAAYTDVAGLAERLGVTRATIRQHIANEVPWLPRPTKLGHAWVWLTTDLEGIEDRRRHPGNPAWVKSAPPAVGQSSPTPTTTAALTADDAPTA